MANRLQTIVKCRFWGGGTESRRRGYWGVRQKHLSFRCPVLQHTSLTTRTLWRCVCNSVLAFDCACAYVETLKWDHRLNQAKALNTHPPLINSPIRKYLHWQNRSQGPIDGSVIRGAGFHYCNRKTPPVQWAWPRLTQKEERWTTQDGLRLMSVDDGLGLTLLNGIKHNVNSTTEQIAG